MALRRVPIARTVAVLLALVAAGFALIQFAAWRDGTPMLDHRLGSVALTGRVIDIDQLERGWRVIIAPDPLPGLMPEEQPRRVRVRIPPTSDPLQPGDRISMRARLYPAPAQVVPGGWDLQRALYFAGIGAVGYSFGPARRVAAPDEARGGGWRDWLLRLRNEMTRAHQRRAAGFDRRRRLGADHRQARHDVGGGERRHSAIPVWRICWRSPGCIWRWSAAFVFLTVRGGLALIPWVALRYPIKKIAAAARPGRDVPATC